jgi:hypothetical protein
MRCYNRCPAPATLDAYSSTRDAVLQRGYGMSMPLIVALQHYNNTLFACGSIPIGQEFSSPRIRVHG